MSQYSMRLWTTYSCRTTKVHVTDALVHREYTVAKSHLDVLLQVSRRGDRSQVRSLGGREDEKRTFSFLGGGVDSSKS